MDQLKPPGANQALLRDIRDLKRQQPKNSRQKRKALTSVSTDEGQKMVAGAGFEPTTSGL